MKQLLQKTARILTRSSIPVLALGLLTSPAPAASLLVTHQVNSVESSQTASAFFTNSPDNLIVLAPVATTVTPGSVGGNIGAGDAATSISTGTITVVGDSTSAGGWTDGNGIPAGITLTFNIQFTTTTTNENSFLTTQANSGTQLGNGIGITQIQGDVGALDPGEVLEISSISISGVSFTGSITEPGFSLTPGSVSNPRWNRLRGNNFAEASEGATVTVGADSWGFGISVGSLASSLAIDNNYTEVSSTFVTSGPMVIETQAGVWNLKGLAFQYEVAYEVTGMAIIPTWTGGGGNSFWSTGANWDGGVPPANDMSVVFGAATRQSNTNDIPDLSLSLITFTTGGFNLFGLPITNTFGISNIAGINNLNLDVSYTGSSDRLWNIASGSQLGIGGNILSYDNGNIDISGAGTLNVSDGSISFDANSTANGNLRLGTLAGDSLTMNVNSGGSILVVNAPTGNNANRLRIGAVAGSTATINVNNGGSIIVPDDAANAGRSLIEVGLGAGTISVLNLNAGGLLHAQRLEANSSQEADSTFNFNGGLLEAHRTAGSTTYFNNLDRVQVRAGGAVVHTTNDISFVLPLTEDFSSPGGGLTKQGPGSLSLPTGNTYTGPTVVSEGTLSLILPVGSSALTLGAGATLSLDASVGSWFATSATLGSGTLNLNFGPGGIGGAPITANTLTLNGTTVINVNATVTMTGSYPLIDYTTIAGAGQFQLGTKPAGTIATLVTNVANSSIDLMVTDLAADLFWTGNVNGDWDIGITPNWDFLTGGFGATTYSQNASVGDFVTFFNGPTTPVITLRTNVKPVQMTFLNSTTDYSIGGAGFGIQGSGYMLVQGGGIVTLTTSNSFSGGVSNNLGFVELGNNDALGTGPVTLWPTLSSFVNTGLRSDGTTARTIANPVQFRSFAANEINFKLGDAVKNGKLTFTGPLDFSNRRNEMSFDSDVVFAGDIGNGAFSKTGSGTLTVTGVANMTADDIVLAQGDLILDGGAWTNSTFGMRLVAQDGVTSRLILTNNAVMTLEGGSNLRVATAVEGSFIQGNGTNEFIMYSGQLNLVGNTAEASIGGSASLSTYGRLSFLGGTALVRGVRGLANAGPTDLILDGVTLVASTNNGSPLPNFISGFTNATIASGGVTIDIPAEQIAYATQDLMGNGGITKIGEGVLLLNGLNSYTGPTLVNGGVLGGSGTISGPLTVGASGILAPGIAVGTLAVNNTLSLAGTAYIEVDKGAMTADLVTGVTDISYGGALVVSNLSAMPLTGGEVFQLFSASGAKNGNFSSITILPDIGLTGTFDPASGQLTLSSLAQLEFDPPFVSGGNIVLTGTGTPSSTYSILTSTSVAAPISTWVTNTTGSFSASGVFSNAIPIGVEPQQFFLLKTP